jgi:intracellular sulfur oxidation DsrE/DsrF family protein
MYGSNVTGGLYHKCVIIECMRIQQAAKFLMRENNEARNHCKLLNKKGLTSQCCKLLRSEHLHKACDQNKYHQKLLERV